MLQPSGAKLRLQSPVLQIRCLKTRLENWNKFCISKKIQNVTIHQPRSANRAEFDPLGAQFFYLFRFSQQLLSSRPPKPYAIRWAVNANAQPWMIKALIFDLDNCLADAKEVGTELYEPAFAAIRRANHCTVQDDKLKQAFEDVWVHPFDWVAAKYGFSEEMQMAGWRELKTIEVTGPLHGYGDLLILAELEVQRFLVTSGFRRLQESKIKALNLNSHFTAIYVDAIDEPDRLGKTMLFRRIMQEFAFTAAEILIVGDNAHSEIEAGNRLGIKTVQILRPGVSQANNATFHISSLADLNKLLTCSRANQG